ncbi:MAG: DUF4332 domain-containing protein [Muribaculaceae bacterium]|nr:DUF4332 domain-containing protein [Muribaculaceae bacterium]
MDYKIIKIEGIGPVYAEKLEALGVNTVSQLLDRGKNVKGRKELAEKTGISGKRILTWVNHADLLRLEGVDPNCAELLEAAGVDTVIELALRNPANLEKKMVAINQVRHLAPKVPSLEELKQIIARAKTLPRIITYGKVKAAKTVKSGKPTKEENTSVANSKEIKTVNIYEDDDVRIVNFDRYDDGKYGLKDERGNWVEVESQGYDYKNDCIPMVTKFDDAFEWEGLIILKEGNDWGIINPDGEWLLSGFGGFEDEGYSYLTGWQDGDEWHIYSNRRITMACMEEDEEEDWDDYED